MQKAVELDRPESKGIKPAPPKKPLDQVQHWTDERDLPAFYWLCAHPPKQSVVASIWPDFARIILRAHNPKNRSIMLGHVHNTLAKEMLNGKFELTGDTIKFSSEKLLDGQHRLSACVEAKVPFTTHVVFGLDDQWFDVLDQNRSRSGGAVLGIEGVPYSSIVCSAIRWVKALESGLNDPFGGPSGRTGRYSKARKGSKLLPRELRAVYNAEFRGITEWCLSAIEISRAFKHPPSVILAILWIISRQNRKLAATFAHEWVHGARIDRNKAFDVLSSRLQTIQRQNNGSVQTRMKLALLIVTFNYWNAGKVPHTSALKWRTGLPFPKMFASL